MGDPWYKDFDRERRQLNIEYTKRRIKRAERWLASPLVRAERTRVRWQRALEAEQAMLAKLIAEKLTRE